LALDHKEQMKRFISYGITFILGSGAGWILSGKHWDIFFTSYVPALATLLAAFYGAKFAFQFQREKDEEKNKEKHIRGCKIDCVNGHEGEDGPPPPTRRKQWPLTMNCSTS